MDLNAVMLPPIMAWVANAIAVAVLLVVAFRVEWRRLSGAERLNGWLLTVGFIVMLWAIRAEVSSGLNLHLSGAALFALLYGWRLAIIGMALVGLVMTVAGRIAPINLGLQFLLTVLLPVSMAYAVFLFSEARLPRNFFVYIFVPAFFGPWLTTVVVAFTTSFALLGLGAYAWGELTDAFLPFYLILGFSEGFITGFLLTLLVVYRPEWVYTFRDERYIKGK